MNGPIVRTGHAWTSHRWPGHGALPGSESRWVTRPPHCAGDATSASRKNSLVLGFAAVILHLSAIAPCCPVLGPASPSRWARPGAAPAAAGSLVVGDLGALSKPQKARAPAAS